MCECECECMVNEDECVGRRASEIYIIERDVVAMLFVVDVV